MKNVSGDVNIPAFEHASGVGSYLASIYFMYLFLNLSTGITVTPAQIEETVLQLLASRQSDLHAKKYRKFHSSFIILLLFIDMESMENFWDLSLKIN